MKDGNEIGKRGTEIELSERVRGRNRERKSKRFFASDLIKVDKEIKNTFLENFTMKDAMKLNKQINKQRKKQRKKEIKKKRMKEWNLEEKDW